MTLCIRDPEWFVFFLHVCLLHVTGDGIKSILNLFPISENIRVWFEEFYIVPALEVSKIMYVMTTLISLSCFQGGQDIFQRSLQLF